MPCLFKMCSGCYGCGDSAMNMLGAIIMVHNSKK